MLSLIACYSMYVAIPLLAVSLSFAPKHSLVFGGRVPKIRPRLWCYVLFIGILAIDFALIPLVNHPTYGFRLYGFDTAVVAIPLLYGASTEHSIWDLWVLAILVGLLGMLFLPGIRAH